MNLFLLRAAVFLLPAMPLRALDPALRISQYHKQYWQVEQGLPHSYVTAVSQDQDGFLLIATDEGIARFDGLNFRPVPSDPALQLNRRWISALMPGRDRSLWVGAFDGQLVQLRDGRTVGQYQMGGSVFDLREDGQGMVRASTRNGVFSISQGKSRKLPHVTAPSETSWNVLAGDSHGQSWVVCADGLFVEHGGVMQRRLAPGAELGDILTVRAARPGGLWLGTSTGLFRLANPEMAQAPRAVVGVRGPVVSLLEDRDGVLWAGTWGQGLFRLAEGKVESWTARDELPDDFIRTLAEDNEGNLWIGTRSGGLGRWKDPRIVPLGTSEGLAGNYATVVMADPAGELWLGTWRGGLYRMSGGRLESQPTPFARLYFTLRAMAFDARGRPWFGNWEGLFQSDGSGFRRYATSPDSPYHRVSTLLFDRRGGLWVGTADQGLFHFAGGVPTEPAPGAILPNTEITSLFEDSIGRIWVGTPRGLGSLSGPAGTYEAVPGLRADTIDSIYEDSRQRIWAATGGGSLFVVSGGKQRVLDRANGLPGHALYRVLEDSEGSFWVSSARGILELRRDSVEDVLAGRRSMLSVVQHDQEDGMRTVECHGLSQPSGWRARNGSLWFPTARGFVEVRSGRRASMPPPRVLIVEARTGLGPLRYQERAGLEAGVRDIEIQFAALRLSNARKVRFRYRMGGFDPDWVNSGELRSARYNQLPPGSHLFEVQARDPGGAWGEAARLVFVQQPRFHQTWWFLLLLALVSMGLVAAVYRWRLHTVRSRYAAVMEERNRIGREWHDTLVAGFSAISLQLEAAMARMREQPERASEILDVTKKMVHHYRAEARRVIWDLRDNRPAEETLSVAVEQAMKRVAENRGIEGVVVVEGQERELPVELRHNVLRICQEAMSNAARHGAPARIDVLLRYAPEELRVRIHDDGRGFHLAERTADATGHFGLTVMQERARRHGGTLRVDSKPGEGTTVEASIPISTGGTK